MSEQETESLLEFPCDFGIKVMGPVSDSFDALVIGIIRKHVGDIKEGAVSSRESSGGKFMSVRVDFIATSKKQLDAIYQELGEQEQVRYIL